MITMIRAINITAPIASTRPIMSASSSSSPSVVVRIGRGVRLVAGARVGLLRSGVAGGFKVVTTITTPSVLSLRDVVDRDEMFVDVAADVTGGVDTSAKSF